MASAKPLGAHVPSALEFLVEESILPPNPAEHLYKWHTYNDDGGDIGEEELITTDKCVVWSQGGVIQRVFRLDLEGQQIIQSLLTWFHVDSQRSAKYDTSYLHGAGVTTLLEGLSPRESSRDSPTEARAGGIQRALVVLLKQQAHIYFLHGSTHIINLPIEVERAFAAPRGLLLQRKLAFPRPAPCSPVIPSVPPNSFRTPQLGILSSPYSQDKLNVESSRLHPARDGLPSTLRDFTVKPRPNPSINMPRLFALADPLLELGLVVESSSGPETSFTPVPIDPFEELLHVSPMNPRFPSDDRNPVLMLTVNKETQCCSIWHGSYHRLGPVGKLNETEVGERGLLSSQNYGSRRSRSSMNADTPASHARTSNRENLLKTVQESASSYNALDPSVHRKSNSFIFERGGRSDEEHGIELDISSPDKKSAANRRTSSMVARAELATHELNSYKDWAPKSGSVSTKAISCSAVRDQNSSVANASRTSLDRRDPFTRIPSATHKADEAIAMKLDHSESSRQDDPWTQGDSKHIPSSHLQDPFKPLGRELVMTRAFSIPICPHGERGKGNASLPAPSRDSEVFSFFSASEDILTMFILDRDHAVLAEIRINLAQTVGETVNLDTDPRPTDTPLSYFISKQIMEDYAIHVTNGILDAVKIQDGDFSTLAVLKRNLEAHLNVFVLPMVAGISDVSFSHACSGPQAEAHGLTLVRLEEHLGTHDTGLLLQQNSNARNFHSIFLYQDGLASAPNISHRLKNPGRLGEFDIVATHGVCHRYQLLLRPRNALVKKVLEASCFALRHVLDFNLLSTWWKIHGKDSIISSSSEWRSLVVALCALVIRHLDEDVEMMDPYRPQAYEWPALTVLTSQDQNSSWDWIDTGTDLAMYPEFSKSFLVDCSKAARDYLKAEDNSGDVCGLTSFEQSIQNYPLALAELVLSLHLIREEEKLNVNAAASGGAASLVLLPMLVQLGQWLGWTSWTARVGCYYNVEGAPDSAVKQMYDLLVDFLKACISTFAIAPPSVEPPCVSELLKQITTTSEMPNFTQFRNHFPGHATENVAPLTPSKSRRRMYEYYGNLTPRISAITAMANGIQETPYLCDSTAAELSISTFDRKMLETLPEGFAATLRDHISRCRVMRAMESPSASLKSPNQEATHKFHRRRSSTEVDRLDRYVCTRSSGLDIRNICQSTLTNLVQLDSRGPRESMKIMFREDTRSSEPATLLCPQLVPVAVMHPTPGCSEAQFLEAQQHHAKLIYTRTMAVVSGQALLDYQCQRPLPTQKLEVLLFNTSCRMQPSGITVNADRSNFVEEKVSWAFFHAGVQTGLRITKDAPNLDTSWLFLNKPAELGNRHAGLLLALGLSGHLKSMAKWLAFKYLTPKHDMTSIGLLLGWSASHFGSMDSLITRVLSVHLESLLPVGSAELNLSPLVQTAATMGIGLLYYNSQHRRMSEKMLLEMEHVDPEGQSKPNAAFTRNEGYRLAAGFALGFINLGKGRDLRALRGLRIEQRLIQLATGPCDINIIHILDRATAGAIMAIALIYLKTHNKEVARKIGIPHTIRRFDHVRPDLLLLRVVATNVIMWQYISPTHKWIWESLPEDLQLEMKPMSSSRLGTRTTVLDFLSTSPLSSNNLSLYNILAGLCWSIALKHAGTADLAARDCLVSYYDKVKVFLTGDPQTFDERLTRDALMRFQHLLILAAATVMSGTGDLVVLKRARVLHATIDESSTFGFHQAAHMALGALFIGQGRFTFGTTNLAVASLLCAFYPIFPTEVLDNRAHLQAFRHFWVFAAECRCIIPRDIETNEPIVAPVRVFLRDNTSLTIVAPALLPDLDKIAKLSIMSDEYWHVNLNFLGNPEDLARFRRDHTVFLRRKSLLAQYGHQFGLTLAARTQHRRSSRASTTAFDWISHLALFDSLGIGMSGARRIFPRGHTKEQWDKKKLFLIEQGKDPAFRSDEGPLISNLLDCRTTGVDDVLVLNDDVKSFNRDRLTGLSLLLEWSHFAQRHGRRFTWADWISEEAIEALRASVLSRMAMEPTEGTSPQRASLNAPVNAMVTD